MSCGCGTTYAATKPGVCSKCHKLFDNPVVAVKPREAAAPIPPPVAKVYASPEEEAHVKGREALAKFGLEPMGEEDVIVRGSDSFSLKDVVQEAIEALPHRDESKPTPAKRGRKKKVKE
jgi:hypothetical protein